jgi:hypothetical protein
MQERTWDFLASTVNTEEAHSLVVFQPGDAVNRKCYLNRIDTMRVLASKCFRVSRVPTVLLMKMTCAALDTPIARCCPPFSPPISLRNRRPRDKRQSLLGKPVDQSVARTWGETREHIHACMRACVYVRVHTCMRGTNENASQGGKVGPPVVRCEASPMLQHQRSRSASPPPREGDGAL